MADDIRILSTRPIEGAASLKGSRIVIDEMSFIEVMPRNDDYTFFRINQFANEPVTAIFTSRHAVEAMSMLPAAPSAWAIACMGGATRKMASDFFGEEKVIMHGRDAADLAAMIISAKNELKHIVFFCGDRRLDRLPDELKASGVFFEEVIVYETRLTPTKLTAAYDAYIFFSPSAVESFFSINNIAANAVLFAIGETTAATAKQYSTNEVVASRHHSAAVLLETIKTYYKR